MSVDDGLAYVAVPVLGDAWEVVFQIFFGESAVVVLEAACISEGVESGGAEEGGIASRLW